MKWLIFPIYMLVVLGLMSFLQKEQLTENNVLELDPIAVVELFTSQGCSSCPPADRVLSELVARAEKKKQPIYALSFHVDYWNYLGWKDPYSDGRFSERQEEYGKALGINLYTPQMLVNGRGAFVGSRKAEAEGNVEKALRQAASVSIELGKRISSSKATVELTYALSEIHPEWVLNVALVERNLKDAVKRGENKGRTLVHDNVVRDFEVLPLETNSGSVKIPITSVTDHSQASVIAYVQHRESMHILGASRLNL